MRRKGLQEQRGSIAVETAITLPLVLLLTLGGITILWWLHNKTWLQVMVSEVARERAADAMVTGYWNDYREGFVNPHGSYQLPGVSLASLHFPVPLPDQPPMVIAAACNHPGGAVPLPPSPGQAGEPLQVGAEALFDQVLAAEDLLEGYLDQGLVLGQRLVWYRRVAEALTSRRGYQQRQAIDYLMGGAVELLQAPFCPGEGELVTAKAVIRGERTMGQR